MKARPRGPSRVRRLIFDTARAYDPGTLRTLRFVLALALAAACRIDTVAPNAGPEGARADDTHTHGDLWVYTSMYPAVVDAFELLAKQKLPDVRLQWFKGGSEKVANRLEAELVAGGSKADVLAVSDPFRSRRSRRR